MARFQRKGVTKVLWATTIASATLQPTLAEVTGATDYSGKLAAVEGFSLENQLIETPDLDSTYVSKIPGDDAAEDSSLTFYEDDATDTLETALAKGTVGYVLICRKGKAAGTKGMDVYKVRVASNSASITVDNEPAKITVKLAITERPLINATIPAT